MYLERGSSNLAPHQVWLLHANEYLNVVDGLNEGNGKGRLLRENVVYPSILERLPSDLEEKVVLDAGTGEGALARLILEKGAKRVVGVDIVPMFLSEAKKRSGCREKLVRADLDLSSPLSASPEQPYYLPFKDDSFDIVICSLTAMWLPNIVGLGPEFARVSKDKATVIVSILNPRFNKGNIDQETGLVFKKIDKSAGPFPYFYRTTEDYQNSLQTEFSTTEKESPHLELVSTHYIRPKLDALYHHPKLLIKRLVQPEFVIFTLQTNKSNGFVS